MTALPSNRPEPASGKPKRSRTKRVPHLSRELSWIEFNARVLHEAADARNPLLERVKFLAIFASNLDEFFQVRISSLRRAARLARVATIGGGPTATEQLSQARRLIKDLVEEHSLIYRKIRKELAREGIEILDYAKVPQHHAALRELFLAEIYPVL